jgi:DedD protein
MARSISDEELQLRKRARRRLIGALVLVTAVAAVLPMVLDSEPRQVSQDVTIRIPSPDSGEFSSKVVPLAPVPETKPQPPATAAKPAPVPAQDGKTAPKAQPPAAPAPEPVKVAPKPEQPAKPAASAAKESARADKDKGQFVVQVIALSDAAKAGQIQQQIANAGIKSYTEIVKTEKGDVTRVRAGPFATRAAAEKARDQLKSMGLNGNIAAK